jgi:hypothetical protein
MKSPLGDLPLLVVASVPLPDLSPEQLVLCSRYPELSRLSSRGEYKMLDASITHFTVREPENVGALVSVIVDYLRRVGMRRVGTLR